MRGKNVEQGEPPKSVRFIFPLLALWIGLTLVLFYFLFLLEDSEDQMGSIFQRVALGCCISFCYFWGIYHWTIVLQRLMDPKSVEMTAEPDDDCPRVAVLYCICDNLDRDAILSATRQDYPAFDVFLLDDSRLAECQHDVDQVGKEHGLSVLRRKDRSHYKAGNLNHALALLSDRYAFVAINDADELLNPGFLRSCVAVLVVNRELAFVQANHSDRITVNDTNFAQRFGVMTDVRWAFYREYANRAGICFSLGHGLVLRTSAWSAVGGYPTVVSEDIAITLRLLAAGWRGRFLRNVMCLERFSETYSRFRERFSRCVEADIECIQAEMPNFLRSSKPQMIEKLDAVIRECRYPAKSLFLPLAIALSVLINIRGVPGFFSNAAWLGLHVCLVLGPWIPYLVALDTRRSCRFFGSSLWAFSSLAVVMLRSGCRAFLKKPVYVVTFRRNAPHEYHSGIWCDAVSGVLALACGILLPSASLQLIGAALVTSPLLSRESWWQSDALSVYLPIVILVSTVFLTGVSSALIVLLPLTLLLY